MGQLLLVLYRVFVGPIEYMIEVVFTIMNTFLGHEGYAIIAVSLTVSTLVLPLYLWADRIQSAEQDKQTSMEKWIAHIKRSFHGDERYMMINAYYSEQKYRPIYALRSLIPLFLQIPFFIAAYRFLSELQRLQGRSFGWIRDLGAPDGLLRIGSFPIHILPVLMTIINIISTIIYTRGSSFKQKIQPLLLALLFLILLYPSPSGLVLYWTMNNLYSLCKNLITKYVKHAPILTGILFVLLSVLYVVYLIGSGRISYALYWKDFEILLIYSLTFVCLLAAAVVFLLKNDPKSFVFRLFDALRRGASSVSVQDSTASRHIFLTVQLCLTVFFGLMIPLLVLSASPMDFLVLDSSTNLFHYTFFTLETYAGLFLFWGVLIYLMIPERFRHHITQFQLFMLFAAFLNVFCFKASVGYVSTMLEFDALPLFSLHAKILNLLLILLLIPVSVLLMKRFRNLTLALSRVLLLSLLVMSIRYVIITQQKMHEVDSGAASEEYIVPLSKSGKNVILIMLDRGVSGYIPFLFDEKPELRQQFAGFTYYPNTISYGSNTGDGAPALYGGYDYSTENMHSHKNSSLSPHNEALCVLPRVFGEAGYRVTVTDPAFAAPEDIDYSIFDPYPYVSAYSLEQNLPTGYDLSDFVDKRERNFVFYSIFRAFPAFLQKNVYDTGGYLAADRTYFLGEDNYRYGHTVLKNLPSITELVDDGNDRYLAFTNNTAHAHVLLTLPDYDDNRIPDYTGIDLTADRCVDDVTLHFDPESIDTSVGSYHSNMSAFLGLGNWFDYLRQIGVYDNCRIVLVSDHGSVLPDFEQHHLSDEINVTPFNPILMVKDFGSDGSFVTDNTFMTNADAPALLTSGLIADPTNPFTGNPLDMSGKAGGVNVFYSNGKWYHIHDNIFDLADWEPIPAPAE